MKLKVDKISWVYDQSCPKTISKIKDIWFKQTHTGRVSWIDVYEDAIYYWENGDISILIPYDASLEVEYELERKEAAKLC